MCFFCLRCGYKAASKQRLLEHLSRKNVCDPKVVDTSTEKVFLYYQKTWSEGKNSKEPFRCTHCGKTSNTNDNAFRCHKYRCKIKQQQQTTAKVGKGKKKSESEGLLSHLASMSQG
jgi:hypothetical protein